MPSAPISGVPIRLQVSTASAPSIPPIDANTGQPPAQWRANAVSYQVGIFDVDGVSVDLTNITYLQLTIAASQTSAANLITAQVLAGDITPTITRADWLNGIAQNASFNLTAAMTDVSLGAQPTQDYWVQLSGVTDTGSLIVYGAGNVTFYNAGSATPAPLTGVTSWHSQNNATGNGTIYPLFQIHTEVVAVSGSAGTRNLAINPGLTYNGAWVYVCLTLPATANITINLLQGDLLGPTIATITTDGFMTQGIFSVSFDGNDYTLRQSSFS